MVVVLGIGFVLSLHAQDQDGVQIVVDPGVRPETVHVNYFLVGGFGGYGGFLEVPPKPSSADLILPIYGNNQRAKSLRAVVYAKGCELRTFTLDPLPPGLSRVLFDCRKLSTVRLNGVVTGYLRPSELTVRIRYVANWSHTFFGITDGAVLTIPIAEVVPGPDGRFTVDLPDFANDGVTDSYAGQADWSITAWRTGTNDQYWLNTGRERDAHPGALPIEREYAKELQFVVKQF